ncbi:MAG TPA: hypothetical protein VGO50_13470 [Pyrinomonadaceae bacterium]|nr:hypothetical protein [Pyrinomonadaceae bacterium]
MRKKCLAIMLFCFFLALGGQVSAQPKMPYRDAGACPFECCTYREWVANKATVLRTKMSEGSSIAFKVKKGEKVRGVTGVVITTQAGVVKALENTVIGESKIRLKAGELIYLLTYTGEGFYETWVKGKIFSDSFYDNTALKLVSEPKSVWWVKIRNRKGQIGWTKLPENFDNKDSCG